MKAKDFKDYLESKGCSVSCSGGTCQVTYNGRATQYGVSQGNVAGDTVNAVCAQLGIPAP